MNLEVGIELTVRSMDGSALLGPNMLPRAMLVGELKKRLVSGIDELAKGEVVEVCDSKTPSESSWYEGVVCSLSPLMVQAESAAKAKEWLHVRKPPGKRPSDMKLFHGTSLLYNHQSLGEVVLAPVAELSAVFSCITFERRKECMGSIGRLACIMYEQFEQSMDEDDIDRDEEAEWLEWQMQELFGKWSNHELADPAIAAEAVENLGQAVFNHLPSDLLQDMTFVIELVRRKCGALIMHRMHESLKADKTFITEVLRHDGNLLFLASNSLQKDADVVLAAIGQNDEVWPQLPDSLTSDKVFVMKAVAKNGMVLSHVKDDFRADLEVVLQAVQQNGGCFSYAAELLKSDKQVVAQVVSLSVRALEFADGDLKADKDFMLKLVAVNGDALQHAHLSLKKEKSIVLQAVCQRGLALRHAHASLRMDKDIVLAAVHNDKKALPFADPSLLQDTSIQQAVHETTASAEHSS